MQPAYLYHFVLLFLMILLVVFIVTPYWIKKAKMAGLIGKDMHKNSELKVAEMGGITVLLGFLIGIMAYIAMRVFIFEANTQIALLLAMLTAVLIAGIIGIIDDILGWKIGLRQWQKPLLTLLVAAPIMAVNAGDKIMYIPLAGNINIGLLYPLIIIPGLIMFSANSFNMLAGYNGLEAGQGIIILSALAYLSYLNNASWVAIVALCMVFALLGFLFYNYFQARIFPGDTLTYTVGTLIGVVAIFGNVEKAVIIILIPYLLEFSLKLRGKFQKESFALVQQDGSLVPRYPKTYGLENWFVLMMTKLKIRATETRAVFCLHGFQLIFVAIAMVVSLR